MTLGAQEAQNIKKRVSFRLVSLAPTEMAREKKPSEKKMQYLPLDRDGRLLWNLREMGDTIRALEEAGDGDLLSSLRDDDKADLLMLLEKLKHGWLHKNK